MRSALPSGLLALALAGCVDDTTVVGGGRPQEACAAALTLVAPPAGCTTVEVLSSDPWGCTLFDPRTGFQRDTAGTWVRVQGSPAGDTTLRVRLLSLPSFCALDAGLGDAGTASCPGEVWTTTGGGTPCSCDPGSVASYGVDGTASVSIPLFAPEQDVLLQPFGATFEVSVCGP